MASDEERLETLQIIQNQLAEVDETLAGRLLRQVEISDERHLEQEIQVLQDRITRTRQKMAASTQQYVRNAGESGVGFATFGRDFCFEQLALRCFRSGALEDILEDHQSARG